VDETFQIEQWGEDAEATARRAALRADIQATRRYLDLVRG
jgi:chaperone required for assembly of F1-ATPase